jgi:transposase-like protein
MGTILPEALEREIEAMTVDQKRALAAELRRMIAEEMSGGGEGPSECPLCHCPRFVRKGKARDGSQRWLCRGCGRTFGRTTMSVLLQSKLGEETWLEYAGGMADGSSLRELAARCHVCLKTSWFMRMRLCEAMGSHLNAFASGPGVAVEVDGTMLHESLSGNPMGGGFEMPRGRHKSGKSLHVRGVSGQLACVVCAANDRGGCICELVGRAHGTADAIRAALEGRIGRGTPVATDDWASYGSVMRDLGCEHEVRPARPGAGDRALGMVNALHKRLADFLRPFNGVATRRLQRYLWWFSWSEQFRHGAADARELVSREALGGGYETTVRDIFREPRFKMEYWEARGWSA